MTIPYTVRISHARTADQVILRDNYALACSVLDIYLTYDKHIGCFGPWGSTSTHLLAEQIGESRRSRHTNITKGQQNVLAA